MQGLLSALPLFILAMSSKTAAAFNINSKGPSPPPPPSSSSPWQSESENSKATITTKMKTSQNQNNTNEKIDWIVRPSTLEDSDAVNGLLKLSYENLLAQDYEQYILEDVLPKICNANEALLTSGTWYVVEHPTDKEGNGKGNKLVGCGGWTPFSPLSKQGPGGSAGDDGKAEEDRHTTTNYPHLRHFGTDPNFKRQGIAKGIWERCWNDLLEYYDGQPQTMEVISTLTAEPFYASLGFEKVQDMSLPLGENCNFPCTLMRREKTKS